MARAGRRAEAAGRPEVCYQDVALAVAEWPAAHDLLADIVPPRVSAATLAARMAAAQQQRQQQQSVGGAGAVPATAAAAALPPP